MSRPPEFDLAMDLIPDDSLVAKVRDYAMSIENALKASDEETMRRLGPSAFLRMDHLCHLNMQMEAENAFLEDRVEALEKALAEQTALAKAAAWAMHEVERFRQAEGSCG